MSAEDIVAAVEHDPEALRLVASVVRRMASDNEVDAAAHRQLLADGR